MRKLITIKNIKKMEKKRKNFNENYAELVEFCKRENRLPQNRFGKEDNRLRSFMCRYKKDPRIIEIREHYRKHPGGGGSKFDEILQDLIEFCERGNRLPLPKCGKDESRLSNFIYVYKDDIRIVEIKEKYSKNKSFNENLQDLVEFCKRENKLPQESHSEGSRLRSFMKRYKEDHKIIAIKKKYSKRGA